MVYVATRRPVDDPAAGRLAAATAGFTTPASLVDPLLDLLPPVPYPAWRDLLVAHTARLLHDTRT